MEERGKGEQQVGKRLDHANQSDGIEKIVKYRSTVDQGTSKYISKDYFKLQDKISESHYFVLFCFYSVSKLKFHLKYA